MPDIEMADSPAEEFAECSLGEDHSMGARFHRMIKIGRRSGAGALMVLLTLMFIALAGVVGKIIVLSAVTGKR
jgi:hypothetical protein